VDRGSWVLNLEMNLVAKFSLRRYEDQAWASIVISLASVVTFLALVAMVLRRISFQEIAVFYGPPTRAGILAATAVTGMLSVIGFGLGLNSAGQRRNDRQRLSWMGFFISSAVLVLTLGVFAFFYLRGESIK
jgi:hypothetical protein